MERVEDFMPLASLDGKLRGQGDEISLLNIAGCGD